jgi:hypothetical protein
VPREAVIRDEQRHTGLLEPSGDMCAEVKHCITRPFEVVRAAADGVVRPPVGDVTVARTLCFLPKATVIGDVPPVREDIEPASAILSDR